MLTWREHARRRQHGLHVTPAPGAARAAPRAPRRVGIVRVLLREKRRRVAPRPASQVARRIPLILVQFLVQSFELGQARLREVDDVDGELLRCHFAVCYNVLCTPRIGRIEGCG